jgi:hypothetical protein
VIHCELPQESCCRPIHWFRNFRDIHAKTGRKHFRQDNQRIFGDPGFAKQRPNVFKVCRFIFPGNVELAAVNPHNIPLFRIANASSDTF